MNALAARRFLLASSVSRALSRGIARALLPGLLVAGVLASMALVGCARVAPYDRAQLAHPSMGTSDLARPSEEHTRAVQEGAVGGGFSAGGGCGCN